tara:strand:- start:4192 stop:4599 length:408 start_codon:yes stop_codon:yes gene_type:complete
MTEKILIIDATDAVLGRLCSYAAKQALLGKNVAIVNCSSVLITGRKREIIDKYNERRHRGGASLNGPHFPKEPFRFVKRVIRGMVSYKQGRGLAAFKRIKCYNQVPAEFAESPKVKAGREKSLKGIRLSELSKEI